MNKLLVISHLPTVVVALVALVAVAAVGQNQKLWQRDCVALQWFSVSRG